MSLKLFFTTSILLFFSITISAQYSKYRQPISKVVLPDSADIAYNSKKNWKLATTQILGFNIGLWSIDRYLLKAEYARISINSMKSNLKHGFMWDNDQMGTNMFTHPYNGGLFYNAARSNGMTFWESAAFTVGGSLTWELFMENQPPSTNDIISTSVGGVVIGEVLYSASDLFIDNRARGKERLGREIATLIITPTRGLTRLINGDAWKKRTTSGKKYGTPAITADISTGVRSMRFGDKSWAKGLVSTTTLNIEYGDPFETDNKQPYDYFIFNLSLNASPSQPVLGKANLTARLHGADLVETQKDYLSLGLYQHLVYYDSDTVSIGSGRIPYRFSAPASLGGGLMYENRRWKDFSLSAYTHINGILLGATLSDHYKVDMRNYNLGSGFGLQAGLNFAYKDRMTLSTGYEGYRLFTWKGYPNDINWQTVDPNTINVQGDVSRATLHAFNVKGSIKLRQQIYLTAMAYFYARKTDYKQYADVSTNAKEGMLMLTYKF